MKRKLFFLSVFAVLSPFLLQAKVSEFYSIEAFYGKITANNTEVLKDFLYQSDGSSANYKILGLSDQEMSEDSIWLNRLITQGVLGLNATGEVIKIQLSDHKVIGHLDISSFTALQELVIRGTSLVNLNLSNTLNLSYPIIESNANLKILLAINTGIKEIELSKNEGLEKIDLSNSKSLSNGIKIENLSQLKEINFSGSYNLHFVQLLNLKNLVRVDLSNINNEKNYFRRTEYTIINTNLEYVNVANTFNIDKLEIVNAGNLKTIIHSDNFRMDYGELIINGITSDTFELKDFYIYNGNIVFENNHNVKYLDARTFYANGITIENNNQLEKLDIKSFKALFIRNNKLTFNNMPKPIEYSTHPLGYSPQQKVIGEDVVVGEELDLSVNYLRVFPFSGAINEVSTEFDWYDGEEKVSVNKLRPGVFSFDEKLSGKTLICEMRQIEFPDLVLEYEVKVVASLSTIEEEMKSKKNISIYPNPTSDFLNIRSKNIIHSLEIYSITGELIKKYDEVNASEKEILVQEWATGIYIIKIKTAKEIKSIRFYKK